MLLKVALNTIKHTDHISVSKYTAPTVVHGQAYETERSSRPKESSPWTIVGAVW
jgi:hypothetical protein